MSQFLVKSALYAGVFASSVLNSSLMAEELPTVLVSAARTEHSTITTTSKISVITRQDIEKSAATNVADVLRQHSGLVVSDIYGDGSSVGIGVRGFGESANANTLIMVDGRRLNNTDIASPDIYSISLNNVERIEVVYGSGSVLFGDQAVGGVVNIITKDPHKAGNQLEVVMGNFNKKEFKGLFKGAISDDLAYKVIVEDRSSDNYRDNNKKDFQQLSGGMDYRYKQGNVFAEFIYSEDFVETPGALFENDVSVNRRQVLPNISNNFSDLKSNTGRVGIKHALTDSWSVEAEATSRKTDGEFILGFANFLVTQVGFQNREVKEFTPRLIGVVPFADKEMIITAGIDLINTDYFLSTVLGDQENEQKTSSIYIQGMMPVNKKLDLTLGFRRAEVENDLIDTATFTTGEDIDDSVSVGEIGLAYELDPTLSVNARIEENYRFVKVDEYTDPIYVSGVPSKLKTQTGVSYELGVKKIFESLDVDLSIFQLDVEDEILYDPVATGAFGPFGANVNIDSTRRQGLLFNIRSRFNKSYLIGMNNSFAKAKIESGTFKDKDVPYVPEVQTNIYVNYSHSENLSVNTEMQYTGDRYVSADFANKLKKLPSYGVVNLSAQYKHSNVSYKLAVNNLLNKEYSEFGLSGFDAGSNVVETYYPSPERYVVGSITVDF